MSNPAALAAVGLALVATGCGATPPRTAERALYLDLRKIVELQESDDWVVDRLEVEATSPQVMRSVCQVEAPARARLIGWLDRRIAAEGGPAEEAWRREGRDLGAITHLLRLERIRLVLSSAHASAEDDCPFWLESDPHFAGLQIDDARFVLLAQSTGSGALFFRGGETALGGSGGIQVMPAWGIAPQLTLAIGVE